MMRAHKQQVTMVRKSESSVGQATNSKRTKIGWVGQSFGALGYNEELKSRDGNFLKIYKSDQISSFNSLHLMVC